MSLRLRHSLGVLAVFSVYAPTSKGSDDNKNLFCQRISAAVEQCTARETPLVIGDFNTVVGSRRDRYENVMFSVLYRSPAVGCGTLPENKIYTHSVRNLIF